MFLNPLDIAVTHLVTLGDCDSQYPLLVHVLLTVTPLGP